jgi:hypothetical protein
MKKEDVRELEFALHRKLLNINSDVRLYRKMRNPDKLVLSELKRKRKCIDATLSATKQLYINYEKHDDPAILYNSYSRLYKSI